MNGGEKVPIMREDDGELLGFVAHDSAGWNAQTIFGYSISRVSNREEAERIIREKGLAYLTGVWQYFDTDDQQWHSCILKEAYEHQVKVIRTTSLGYQDPDDYNTVMIQDHSETNLIKT
jgi:hypothetical protein